MNNGVFKFSRKLIKTKWGIIKAGYLFTGAIILLVVLYIIYTLYY